mmetsp:Transcript_85388/g.236626  ORF Transcript_85388/g.236626 Transcript_85388/m.236626 type:complete len:274 (-) Transcript_85388:465-1286(-)
MPSVHLLFSGALPPPLPVVRPLPLPVPRPPCSLVAQFPPYCAVQPPLWLLAPWRASPPSLSLSSPLLLRLLPTRSAHLPPVPFSQPHLVRVVELPSPIALLPFAQLPLLISLQLRRGPAALPPLLPLCPVPVHLAHPPLLPLPWPPLLVVAQFPVSTTPPRVPFAWPLCVRSSPPPPLPPAQAPPSFPAQHPSPAPRLLSPVVGPPPWLLARPPHAIFARPSRLTPAPFPLPPLLCASPSPSPTFRLSSLPSPPLCGRALPWLSSRPPGSSRP